MSKWRLDGLHGQSQNPVKYVKKRPLGEVLVLQGGKVSRRPSKVTFRRLKETKIGNKRRPLGDQILSKRRLSVIIDQSFIYSFFE